MLITVHRWRRVYLRFGRFVRDLTNMRYGIRITSIGRTRVKIDVFLSAGEQVLSLRYMCEKIYIGIVLSLIADRYRTSKLSSMKIRARNRRIRLRRRRRI